MDLEILKEPDIQGFMFLIWDTVDRQESQTTLSLQTEALNSEFWVKFSKM